MRQRCAPSKWHMEDRAELLHRRIEAHRCYLAIGADITLVRLFLSQIAADEAELVMTEKPVVS
jgi:hypothetical protein